MSEAGGHKQTDDHSKAVHGSGSITEVKLIGFDKPLLTAVALAMAALALIIAFWAEREARMGEYYSMDMEVYLLKQGFKPPQDPWTKGDHK